MSAWVTILIDFGSTYNFLNPIVVTKNKLPLHITKIVKVRVTNGELLPNEGKSGGVRGLNIEFEILLRCSCFNLGWM